MFVFLLFFFIFAVLSGITTIPLAVSLLVVGSVFFRKSWVFFAAFGIGLLLDLFFLRDLGSTALMLIFFVLLIHLYERKFETRTIVFVFVSSFLGSFFYLQVFGYQQILMQSFADSLLAVLLFKILIKHYSIKELTG